MKPAKRKVAARKGKAPVKRGGAKKARNGTARRAGTTAKAVVCAMSVAELAAALDGAEGAAAVASHLRGCPACTTSLAVLAASGQGLKSLTSEGAGTAVERVLARGQEAGRRQAADLVYELTKACLVVVQDVDRRLHLEQRPRSADAIDRDVRGVTPRLTGEHRVAVAGLPSARPSEERALGAAQSCISILEQVEGETERQRLSLTVWLICNRRPAEAERLLRGMVESDALRHRQIALWNLTWALNRQGKYAESIDVGRTAIRDFPSDWSLAYNLAVAIAWTKDRASFRAAAKKLKALSATSGPDRRFRSGILQYESPRFAEVLGVPAADVRRWLGVSGSLAEARA